MKKLLVFIFFAITIQAYSQQIPKIYWGTWSYSLFLNTKEDPPSNRRLPSGETRILAKVYPDRLEYPNGKIDYINYVSKIVIDDIRDKRIYTIKNRSGVKVQFMYMKEARSYSICYFNAEETDILEGYYIWRSK